MNGNRVKNDRTTCEVATEMEDHLIGLAGHAQKRPRSLTERKVNGCIQKKTQSKLAIQKLRSAGTQKA
jgi:hypothetical protein